MTELSEKDRKILEGMKVALEVSAREYIFDRDRNSRNPDNILQQWKETVTQMVANMVKEIDYHVTEGVNNTGWSDKMLFHFFESQNIDITSFENIKEISMEWKYDPETRRLSMIPVIQWIKPVERIVLEINIDNSTDYSNLEGE